MKKGAKRSLSDQIQDLLKPEPETRFEAEEDLLSGAAKLDDYPLDDSASEPVGKSSLRMQADKSLTEGKYAGKRSSRKSFETNFDKEEKGESSDGDSSDWESIAFPEEESGDESADDQPRNKMSKKKAPRDDDDDDDDKDEKAFEKAYEIESGMKQLAQKETRQGRIQLLSEKKEEREKATHAANQRAILDSLLHVRISQQKALNQSNRLPQLDMMGSFLRLSPKVRSEQGKVLETLQSTVSSLLQLSLSLRDQNEEYKTAFSQSLEQLEKKQPVDSENEDSWKQKIGEKRRRYDKIEIPAVAPTSSLSLSDFWWKRITDLNQSIEPFIFQHIDKWNRKTQLSSVISQTAFKAINVSILEQIERTLMDKQSLINKTQIRRPGTLLPLGKRKIVHESSEACNSPANPSAAVDPLLSKIVAVERKKDRTLLSKMSELDPEIFDDVDFYQQLLKELIETETSSESHNELAITRAWLKNNEKDKVRRSVDHRASKGRKIRYTIHERLVNFASATEQDYPHYVDDLFSHLFRD